MKKTIAKKGFTLVECVIAIAVFAILTSMILFIVGNAVKTSKYAYDEEKNLNGLVQNIVQDQSPKRYGDYDSDTLKMDFSRGTDKADFSMTYSTVDGYKNYVQCPICAANGNGGLYTNMDFMADAAYSSSQYKSDYASDNTVNTRYKASHWFNPQTMAYKCPECGSELNNSGTTYKDEYGNAVKIGTEDVVYSIKLRCLSCENEDYYNECSVDVPDSSVSFMFDTNTGNYICQKCQSGNVVQVLGGEPITNGLTSDAGLQISGMSANTIRYSNIEEPTAEQKVNHVTLDGTGITEDERVYKVTLKADSSNPAVPTKYTLYIEDLHLEEDHTADMEIELPGSYILEITDVSSNINGDSPTKAKTEVIESTNYRNSNKKSKIRISGITKVNTGSTFQIDFTLSNYINNNSFDYDYNKEGGLHKFWFGVEPNYSALNVGNNQLTFDKTQAIVLDPTKGSSSEEEGG